MFGGAWIDEDKEEIIIVGQRKLTPGQHVVPPIAIVNWDSGQVKKGSAQDIDRRFDPGTLLHYLKH